MYIDAGFPTLAKLLRNYILTAEQWNFFPPPPHLSQPPCLIISEKIIPSPLLLATQEYVTYVYLECKVISVFKLLDSILLKYW